MINTLLNSAKADPERANSDASPLSDKLGQRCDRPLQHRVLTPPKGKGGTVAIRRVQ